MDACRVTVWGHEGGGAWVMLRIPKQNLLSYEAYLCVGYEVINADIERTCLSTIFCHFWAWMSGCDGLWVICVRSLG